MLMRPSASELIVTSDDSSTIGAGGLGKLKISRTDGLTEGSGTQREMALRKSVAAISTGLGGEEESVTRSVTGPKLPLVSITWCSPATISKFRAGSGTAKMLKFPHGAPLGAAHAMTWISLLRFATLKLTVALPLLPVSAAAAESVAMPCTTW